MLDQVQIGKFIAACRKEKHLTQAQLAEKLGVSDRAVSKWETGRSMPDASIMPELCREIDITLNDLFSGRRITMTMENYKEAAEATMLKLKENEERAARKLLDLEVVIGMISVVCFVTLIGIVSGIELPLWTAILIGGIGTVQFLAAAHVCLKIETNAGYYECAECGHRYIPKYSKVLWAPHFGRTRHMVCPKCGKKSWQKKVITAPKD